MNLKQIDPNSLIGLLDLLEYITVHELSFVKRQFSERFVYFDKTIDFLLHYSLIYIQNDEVHAVPSSLDPKNRIIRKIQSIRKEFELLDIFLDKFTFTEKGFSFLPSQEQIILFADERKLLIGLDALCIIGEELVVVNPDLIVDSMVNKITQDDLRKLIDKDRIIGDLAEKIVLDMERKLFVENFPHLPISNVIHVSVENPSAGYDILSFLQETLPDGSPKEKYIEVKAIPKSGESFYWSMNEINTAKKYGHQYYIYLVPDPLSLNNNEEITKIGNAYTSIYENPDWEREEKEILFIKKRAE